MNSCKHQWHKEDVYQIALTAVSAAVLSVLYPAEALSQETKTIEKIEVTAQKRTQSIDEIGMAINAFSGDTLEDLGVNDTTDLANIVPGLTLADSGRGLPVYTLRGVGFNGDSYLATSTVSIYVDEVAIPYPVMTLGALLDVERVEVLKGPQGTLYGRNTTGGAINYIAAKPSDDFEASFTASYGSFETAEVEGFVTGALTDSVNARFAIKTIQANEGWQRNVFNDERLGEQDKTSMRLSIDAQITDKLYSLLQLGRSTNESDTQAPQLVRSEFQNPNNANIVNLLTPFHDRAASQVSDPRDAGWTLGQDFSFDTETTYASLRFEYEVSDNLDFVSVSGYSKFEDFGTNLELSGFSGVPYELVPQPFTTFLTNPLEVGGLLAVGDIPGALGAAQFNQNVGPDGNPFVTNSSLRNTADIEFYSQEFRLVGSTDNLDWVAGLYYSKDENNNLTVVNSDIATNTNNLGLPFVNFTNFGNIAELEATTTALFLHTEWAIGENYNLTLGGRYSDDTMDFLGCSRDQDGSGFAAFVLGGSIFGNGFDQNGCATILLDANGIPIGHGEVENSLDENSFSWRAGLDWQANQDTLIYGSISRGFKAGAFNNTSAQFDLQYEPVVQEELLSYELGLKASLLNNSLQFNASIYNYDYKDKQLLSAVQTAFGTLRVLDNAPEARITGAEVDIQWLPSVEGLFISSSLSWVDTEVEEFFGTDLLATDTNIDFSGSEFVYTPEFQFKFLFNYEWEVSDYLAFVGADMVYSDEFQTDYTPNGGTLDPDLVADSYTLVGARVGIMDNAERWRLTFWARNLTDELYITNVVKPSDTLIRFTGMPRTVGVSFTYNYY